MAETDEADKKTGRGRRIGAVRGVEEHSRKDEENEMQTMEKTAEETGMHENRKDGHEK